MCRLPAQCIFGTTKVLIVSKLRVLTLTAFTRAAIADVMITLLTTRWFLQHKSLDIDRYRAEVEHVEILVEPSEMEKLGLLQTGT